MLRTSSLKLCGPQDLPEILDLLAQDPVANVFVASRLEALPAHDPSQPWRLGAELWGYVVRGRLEALCYAGANLVPVNAGPSAIAAFADRALRTGRRCSSLVGPREMVAPLWDVLEPLWGPARDVRDCQPLCVLDGPPRVQPDPRVRAVRPDELDLLLPACIAMFTEEVGVSPVAHDSGALYRARVAELISSGRAFARIDDGQVVFKAEVGAAWSAACQVQGVWVAPERRGEGLSGPGMAAVVELARATISPVVSLYVNDYNTAARATYERVGFRQVGTFMSVLF